MSHSWQQPLSSIPRQDGYSGIEQSMSLARQQSEESTTSEVQRDDARRIISEIMERELGNGVNPTRSISSSTPHNNNNRFTIKVASSRPSSSSTTSQNNTSLLSSQYLGNNNNTSSSSSAPVVVPLTSRSPTQGTPTARSAGVVPLGLRSSVTGTKTSPMTTRSESADSVRSNVKIDPDDLFGDNSRKATTLVMPRSSGSSSKTTGSVRGVVVAPGVQTSSPTRSYRIQQDEEQEHEQEYEVTSGVRRANNLMTKVVQDPSLSILDAVDQEVREYHKTREQFKRHMSPSKDEKDDGSDYFANELLRAGAATPTSKKKSDPYRSYKPQGGYSSSSEDEEYAEAKKMLERKQQQQQQKSSSSSSRPTTPQRLQAGLSKRLLSETVSSQARRSASASATTTMPMMNNTTPTSSSTTAAFRSKSESVNLVPVTGGQVPSVHARLMTNDTTSFVGEADTSTSSSSVNQNQHRSLTPTQRRIQQMQHQFDLSQMQAHAERNNSPNFHSASGKRTNSPHMVKPISAVASSVVNNNNTDGKSTSSVKRDPNLPKLHVPGDVDDESSSCDENGETKLSLSNKKGTNDVLPATSPVAKTSSSRARSPRTEAEVRDLHNKIEDLTKNIEECFKQSTEAENLLRSQIRELEQKDQIAQQQIQALKEQLEENQDTSSNLTEKLLSAETNLTKEKQKTSELEQVVEAQDEKIRILEEKLKSLSNVGNNNNSNNHSISKSPSPARTNNSEVARQFAETTNTKNRSMTPPHSSDAADSWEPEEWSFSPLANRQKQFVSGMHVSSSSAAATAAAGHSTSSSGRNNTSSNNITGGAQSPATRAFEERMKESNAERKIQRERLHRQQQSDPSQKELFSPPPPPRLRQPDQQHTSSNNQHQFSTHQKTQQTTMQTEIKSNDSPPRSLPVTQSFTLPSTRMTVTSASAVTTSSGTPSRTTTKEEKRAATPKASSTTIKVPLSSATPVTPSNMMNTSSTSTLTSTTRAMSSPATSSQKPRRPKTEAEIGQKEDNIILRNMFIAETLIRSEGERRSKIQVDAFSTRADISEKQLKESLSPSRSPNPASPSSTNKKSSNYSSADVDKVIAQLSTSGASNQQQQQQQKPKKVMTSDDNPPPVGALGGSRSSNRKVATSVAEEDFAL